MIIRPKRKSTTPSGQPRKTSRVTPVKTPRKTPRKLTPGPQKPCKSKTPDKKVTERSPPKVLFNDDEPMPTPPRSPTKVRAVPNPRTPEGVKSRRVCDHEDEPWVHFQGWDHTYYAESWLYGADLTVYPMRCCGPCQKYFTTKPKKEIDVTKEFKVTNANRAWICPNAVKPNHACVHVLCQMCMNMEVICADGKHLLRAVVTFHRYSFSPLSSLLLQAKRRKRR